MPNSLKISNNESLNVLAQSLKSQDGVKRINESSFAILDPKKSNVDSPSLYNPDEGIGYQKLDDKYVYGRWTNLNSDTHTFTPDPTLTNLVKANIAGRTRYGWMFEQTSNPNIHKDASTNILLDKSPKEQGNYYLCQNGTFIKTDTSGHISTIGFDDARYDYLIKNIDKLTNGERTFEQLLSEAAPSPAPAPAPDAPASTAASTVPGVANPELPAAELTAAANKYQKELLENFALLRPNHEREKEFRQIINSPEGIPEGIIARLNQANYNNDIYLNAFKGIVLGVNQLPIDEAQKAAAIKDIANKFSAFSNDLDPKKQEASLGKILGFLQGREDKKTEVALGSTFNLFQGPSAPATEVIKNEFGKLALAYQQAEEQARAKLAATLGGTNQSESAPGQDLEEEKYKGLSEEEKQKMSVLRKGVIMAGQIAAVAALGVTASPLVAALAAGALLWWYSKQSAAQKDLEATQETAKLQKEELALKEALAKGGNYELAEDVMRSLQNQSAQAQGARKARSGRQPGEREEPQQPAPGEDQSHPAPDTAINQPNEPSVTAGVNAANIRDAEVTIEEAGQHLENAEDLTTRASRIAAGRSNTVHSANPMQESLTATTAQPSPEQTQMPIQEQPLYDLAQTAVTVRDNPTYDLASTSPNSQTQHPVVVVQKSEPLYDNANTEGTIIEHPPTENVAPNIPAADLQAAQTALAQVERATNEDQPVAPPTTTPSKKILLPTPAALNNHTAGDGVIQSSSHNQGSGRY